MCVWVSVSVCVYTTDTCYVNLNVVVTNITDIFQRLELGHGFLLESDKKQMKQKRKCPTCIGGEKTL